MSAYFHDQDAHWDDPGKEGAYNERCSCPSCKFVSSGTPKNPELDRKWMQNDFLDAFADSSEVTVALMKRRAKNGNLRFVDEGSGNLISSMVAPDMHRPVLDLDFPHVYVPSTTPGHGHLYINNVVLNDLQHYLLISTLVELGILSRGSKIQLDSHGLSLTRPPHVKKKDHAGRDLKFDEHGERIWD